LRLLMLSSARPMFLLKVGDEVRASRRSNFSPRMSALDFESYDVLRAPRNACDFGEGLPSNPL